MSNKVLRKVIRVVAGLLMVFIFFMSSRSIEVSRMDSARVMRFLGLVNDIEDALDLSNGPLVLIHNALRRWTHHILYAILGILYFLSIYRMGRLIKSGVIAFPLAVAYGASDEIHQYFSGRGARLYDVGVDAIGAFFGILIVMLIFLAVEKNANLQKLLNRIYDISNPNQINP